jgi:hypothetical protein
MQIVMSCKILKIHNIFMRARQASMKYTAKPSPVCCVSKDGKGFRACLGHPFLVKNDNIPQTCQGHAKKYCMGWGNGHGPEICTVFQAGPYGEGRRCGTKRSSLLYLGEWRDPSGLPSRILYFVIFYT